MAKIRTNAYRWVPPFAQGLVRDLRVRWALEELGVPYEVELIDLEVTATPEYLARQPFGLLPLYEEDGIEMFESGAILLHIAEKSEILMPADPRGRARARSWIFAALNSVEPFIQQLSELDLFHAQEDWAKLRRPSAVEALQDRLRDLSNWLEGKEYLEGRFTAADLLMTTVLRVPRHTSLIADLPVLDAYRKRCEARPAFKRALDAQMDAFARHPRDRPRG